MKTPIALVTGASRGIGRAVAVALGADGWLVVLLARTESDLGETTRLVVAAGGQARPIVLDVTNAADVANCIAQLAEKEGRLDLLVNNAGLTRTGPLDALSPEDVRQVLEVDLIAPILMTRHCLPLLRKSERGHIVNIGSTAATTGFPEWTAYCAAKAGLLGFSRALREELRGDGIRVTDVLPGATDTSIWNGVPGDWPRDRMMRAEDIASTVLHAVGAPNGVSLDEILLRPAAGQL